ncbi:hypothetical protein BBW65_05305 [Helicobacter enhydrae]|uniref:Ribonuclease n=1 Tax=Helicobacter enhydrae TaxID=222136 RepID=A0A1B1U628_9HELI|nr:ribonuclease HII [Helicobacter enhydrae]ANV98247.1 hypothetical protein BBW65_05305 [Helicobacter enhydrae]
MICGIDEAGRGCIGGSLFVCGVAYCDTLISSLNTLPIKDSKKLSEAQREKTAQALLHHSQIHHILVQKTPQEIDSLGLSLCLKLSLEEIMQKMHSQHQITRFIYDGNSTFKAQIPFECTLQTLIKGDMLMHQISSASILAKYAKDQECKELDTLHPNYGFASHSGYCTSLHKAKIAELGLTPAHRRSFKI